MTPNRLPAIAFRWSISAVFTLWLFAPNAQPLRRARPAPAGQLFRESRIRAGGESAGAAAAAGDPYALMQAQVKARAEEENRQRWAGPHQSPASYDPKWMGQDMVVSGTVSRVEVITPGHTTWVTIYFKESPDATFVVCSPHPDMFQERVGPDLSVLIGQTLEVAGQVESPYCGHKVPKGSIRVLESRQWQIHANVVTAQKVVAAGSTSDAGNTNAGLPLGKVNLSVCNAGKVDIDAFVAKQGPIASSHIVPSACVRVYAENAGEVPAYVGLALVDSRGQWGTARRLDLLPDFGIDVLTRADKNVSVRRGNKDVPAQLQLLFRPRNPSCWQNIPYEARARLPLNATAGQRARADSEDASRAETVCDTRNYSLNVVAYPDSREITFADKCTQCPSNVHPLSPAQQAAAKQTLNTLSAMSPTFGQAINRLSQQEPEEQGQSLEAQRISWNDLLLASSRAHTGDAVQVPKNILIEGTVLRVDIKSPASSKAGWVNIYFKESPDGAFNVCSSSSAIFQDIFGPDFRSSMIGKTLEIEGEVTRAYCDGHASIRVSLAHQVHPVGAAR